MPLLKIDINLGDTIQEFKLDSNQVNDMVSAVSQALTLEIYRNWTEAAKQQLHSTRNNYIKGLILKNEENGINSITLVGQLNNMIENGCEPFDMKESFKESAKVHFTKDGGWYLTIPFRLATPGAIGENEAFSGVMPSEIYDIVRNQIPTITSQRSGTIYGGESLKKGNIPTEYAIPKTRAAIVSSIGRVFDEYKNKSSIYEGLMRNQKTYEKATQSTYGTFRRVSDKSDPNSWIFRGIKQYDLADDALKNTDSNLVVNNMVDKCLAEMGFGD
jgi:hypothetical protein